MTAVSVRRVVVRAMGSGRCHVADIPDDCTVEVTQFGSKPFEVVALDPVVTACRAELRESRGLVIVMQTASVDCRTCRALTQVSAVSDAVVEEAS